jgi:arabinofuranosyltransferase
MLRSTCMTQDTPWATTQRAIIVATVLVATAFRLHAPRSTQIRFPARAVSPGAPRADRERRQASAPGATRWSALATGWVPLVVAAGVLAARVIRIYDPHLIVDDAFISFRYASNLAHGLGLVYNPGERVEGYSNFLWTVLLAAGMRLGCDVVLLSVLLSLAAALGSVAVLWAWSRRLFISGPAGSGAAHGADGVNGAVLAALPPLVFAAMGSQARYVVSGMETLLFGFLVVAASYLLFMRDRPAAAGCVFALAAMTRPEGAMYALLAGGLDLLAAGPPSAAPAAIGLSSETPTPQDRRPWTPIRRSLVLAAGFLAIFLPYFAWRYAWYGYPLPNTYYVKAAGFSLGRVTRGAKLLAEVATWWSIYPLVAVAAAALPFLVPNGTAPPLADRSALRLRRSCYLSAAFVVATIGYFLYAGGDFLAFFGPRFLMPALPFLLLLASAGLGNLCRWASGMAGSRRGLRIAVAAAVAMLFLANAQWYSWPARYFDRAGLARLMASWEDLGRYLGAATPPNVVIADGGAGIVPYFSGRVNIDMYGLADLHIGHMTPLPVGFKQVAHEKYDPRYVLRRRPDLLVTYLDRQATPRTAGLPRVKDWVWACYRPWVLLGDHPSADGSWLLPSRIFNAGIFDAGYRVAVLERRHGLDAARCAAYEGD